MTVTLFMMDGRMLPGDCGDIRDFPQLLHGLEQVNETTTALREFIRKNEGDRDEYIEVPSTPVTIIVK